MKELLGVITASLYILFSNPLAILVMGSLAILNLMNSFVTFSFGISDVVTKLPRYGHGTEGMPSENVKRKTSFLSDKWLSVVGGEDTIFASHLKHINIFK